MLTSTQPGKTSTIHLSLMKIRICLDLVNEMIESVSKEILDYEPNIQPRPDDDKISSLTYFHDTFGAESLVFEIGDNTSREVLKRKGEVSANQLMRFNVRQNCYRVIYFSGSTFVSKYWKKVNYYLTYKINHFLKLHPDKPGKIAACSW